MPRLRKLATVIVTWLASAAFAQTPSLVQLSQDPKLREAMHRVGADELDRLPEPAWLTSASQPYYTRSPKACWGFGSTFEPTFFSYQWGPAGHEVVGYLVNRGLVALRLTRDEDQIDRYLLSERDVEHWRAQIRLARKEAGNVAEGLGWTLSAVEAALVATGVTLSPVIAVSMFFALPKALEWSIETANDPRDTALQRLQEGLGTEALALRILTRMKDGKGGAFVRYDTALLTRQGLFVLNRCYYARSP